MADMFLVIIIIFALNPPFLYKIIRPQIPSIVSFFPAKFVLVVFPPKLVWFTIFFYKKRKLNFFWRE